MDQQLLQDLAKYGVQPIDESLYKTAFIHRSYLNEFKDIQASNERLEFLGDSVLSFIVSTYLYINRPNDAEGELTNLRAFIVKTDSLAKASRQLNLGNYLKLSKGEDVSGGRKNSQLLANTFEALLGAIYLDQGVEAARTFVYQVLLPLFEKEIEGGAPKDFKSQLQEMVQNKYQVSPRYRVLGTSGPDHAKSFTIGVFVKDEMFGKGDGTNKQQAEERSAEEAVIRLTKAG